MWYDPVFKVTTLDGVPVWRRRHYRVKRAGRPGQFNLSVSDNGVTSREFWRIVDCADDLSWAVFYYTGAAAAAGTSYSGALLVTRTGDWPEMSTDSDTALRIERAMATGGIKMWELFEVPNECCDGTEPGGAGPPPLGIR
jgi:VDE lipocalin domain